MKKLVYFWMDINLYEYQLHTFIHIFKSSKWHYNLFQLVFIELVSIASVNKGNCARINPN